MLDGTTLHYTYDEVGNITSITKNNESQPYATYEYDELNQLVRENRSDLGVTYVFTYDKAGNILTKSSCAYTTGEVSNLTTLEYGYYQGDWKDLLVSFDANSIKYDAIGNPTTYYHGEKFTWKDGRKLIYAELDNIRTLDIQYDVNGLMYKKTLTTTLDEGESREVTEYNYSGDTLMGLQVYKYLNSDTPSESYRIWFIYDETGDIIGFNKGGDVYYYSKNIAGDVLALVQQDGTVVARYSYDAWGQIFDITDGSDNDVSSNGDHIANLNPMRYRGYYYDKDLELYYLQSRFYDAETGRFINGDGYVSTGQGLLGSNMFAYCLNNPVLYCDLSGTRPGVRYFGNGVVGYNDTGTGRIKKSVPQPTVQPSPTAGPAPQSTSVPTPPSIKPYSSYGNRTGSVYIVTSDKKNEVEKIMRDRDILILDERNGSSNPNMKIVQSYTIVYLGYQIEIAQAMIDYNASNPSIPAWNRTSVDSIILEWRLHNFAYDMHYKRDHSADADIDNEDNGKQLWDYIGR